MNTFITENTDHITFVQCTADTHKQTLGYIMKTFTTENTVQTTSVYFLKVFSNSQQTLRQILSLQRILVTEL